MIKVIGYTFLITICIGVMIAGGRVRELVIAKDALQSSIDSLVVSNKRIEKKMNVIYPYFVGAY